MKSSSIEKAYAVIEKIEARINSLDENSYKTIQEYDREFIKLLKRKNKVYVILTHYIKLL